MKSPHVEQTGQIFNGGGGEGGGRGAEKKRGEEAKL